MKFRIIAQNLIITALLAVLCVWGSFSAFAETEPYTDESVRVSTQVSQDNSVPDPAAKNTDPTLPEVDLGDIEVPKAVASAYEKDDPSLTFGFILWIVLGVVVAALVAVILTSKTKAFRGGGKKRYSTGDKMSGKTHLLNDKYYHKKRK